MAATEETDDKDFLLHLRQLTVDAAAAGLPGWSESRLHALLAKAERLTVIETAADSVSLSIAEQFVLSQRLAGFGAASKAPNDETLSCGSSFLDFFRLNGRERETFSFTVMLQRIHDDDRAAVAAMMERCEINHETAICDCRLLCPDRQLAYVRIGIGPLGEAGNGKERHLITIQNASADRRTALLLDVQREFVRALSATDIDELLLNLLRLGGRIDGIDLAGIFMPEEGTDTLTMTVRSDDDIVRDGRKFSLPLSFFRKQLGMEDRPVYFDSADIDRILKAGYPDYGRFSALALVPVPIGRGGVAIMAFSSREHLNIPDFSRSIIELIGADIGSIVGRLLAERALELSEKNYRMLVENQRDLVVKVGMDGKILFASRSCGEFFRNVDMVGQPFTRFIRRHDRAEVMRRMKEDFPSAKSFVFEQQSGEGDQGRWVSWQCNGISDPKTGEVTALLGIGREITEYKKTENLLRQSERRLRLILKAVSDCLWDWDLVQDVLTYDYKLYEILGYAHGEIKISFFDIIRNFVHIEDRRRVEKEIRRLIDGELEAFDGSFRMQCRNGEYIWVLMRAVLVRNLRSEPVRMVGCLEDITDRLNFDRIKENYTFLQKILDALPLPVYYKDMNGNYMGYNKAMLRSIEMYRRNDREVIGHSAAELIPEEYRYIVDRIEAEEQKLLKEGGHASFNLQVFEDNNVARELVMHKSLVYGANNEPECIVGAMIDVTDLKKTENALKVASQRLNTILNVMHEIIIWFDADMRVVWANRAAYEAFGGMAGRDITGMNCRDLWLPFCACDDKEKADSDGKAAFRIGRSGGKEIFRLKDGRIFQTWFYPVNAGSGDNGWVQLAQDVSEQENARDEARLKQEQLIQADKMTSLGILVSGVAHEINNPNNFIVINVSILKKAWENILKLLDEYAGEKGDFNVAGVSYAKFSTMVSDLLDGIDEGAERIRVIVNDLKDYVRQTPTDLKGSFNINDALSRAFTLCRNMIKRATNNYKIIYGNNLPVVRGDVYRIEQVIINIVQNACNSLKSRENAITVSTYCLDEHEVVIEVTDEGEGITPEQMKHITDPFFTTKRDIGGTGLGLAISSSIIEDHNGRLQIDSTPGVGTTVKICLPVPKEKSETKRARSAGQQP